MLLCACVCGVEMRQRAHCCSRKWALSLHLADCSFMAVVHRLVRQGKPLPLCDTWVWLGRDLNVSKHTLQEGAEDSALLADGLRTAVTAAAAAAAADAAGFVHALIHGWCCLCIHNVFV